ncbi:hypothetical protein [Lyticum sinuosum]|uniref:1-deoxy-D-xylulose 5-phosphate reductoisomerase n=1 Tax=Lyticum sinuosum TaxID=1332059 RepID=A0AAE5AHD5_9RICK|nr:hypothetical protein [Lyticum sinuosum]MDZ5761445.1 1-deoxy-D-xylulose 5-phosphate reductoisomerase [Lyticum sinuosum]
MNLHRKSILLLGGTGSIGSQVCNIVAQYPDIFHVKTIICKGDNPRYIAALAKKLRVNKIVTNNHDTNDLRILLSQQNTSCLVNGGNDAVIDACQNKHDICISAISGIAALLPLIAAIPYCETIGLANKESIICLGDYIIKQAKKHDTKIIPLDSEHNALFELLGLDDIVKNNIDLNSIRKIIITASGGPLWKFSTKEMDQLPQEKVLKHPTWGMGQKISIDSATMINKGFEIVEVERLFNIKVEDVEVIVNRQSLIHAGISYKNGSTNMYFGPTTMEIPIANFLFKKSGHQHNIENIDFASLEGIEFNQPDDSRFPLLKFAVDCYKHSRQALVALNAANESTVKAYIEKKIKFTDIAKINMIAVDEANKKNHPVETPAELIHYHDIVSALVYKHIFQHHQYC